MPTNSFLKPEDARQAHFRHPAPLVVLFISLFILFGVSTARRQALAEQKEADIARDEKGAIINKDVHVNIPEDQKIVQVASNVIKVQDQEEYVKGRLDTLEGEIQGLEKQIAQMTMLVSVLEKRVDGFERKP